MNSLVVALLGLAVVGGVLEKGGAPAVLDVCLFMRGAAPIPEVPALKAAQEALAAGDAVRALQAFRNSADGLEAEAQRLFFDAVGEDSAQARTFLDEQVNGKSGILAIRGDRFTLRPEVLSFGAWLSCRTRDASFGKALLKSGWRDFADVGFRTDAVFLMVEMGKLDEAAKYLPEGVGGERETLARGLLACRTGKADEGKALLTKALETLTDLTVRGAARQALDACGGARN